MKNPLRNLFAKRPPLGEQATVAGLSPSMRPGILGALSSLTGPAEEVPGG